MNICFVAKTCDPKTGGIGRHIFELSNHLEELGHDVTILTRPGNDGVKGLKADIVEIDHFGIGSMTLDQYFAVPWFYRYLKRNGDDFDVIHCHELLSLSGYFAKLRSVDSNFVYTVHGVAYELISRNFLKPLAKILHFPERLCVRSFDRVVAVSENTRNETLEHYNISDEKVETIYNGVDTDKFRPVKEFDNQLLFVGYFIERKGSDLVVDAFCNLADDFPNTKLVLVGKGRMEEELREKVSNSGLENRVDFRKNVSDEELRDLYSSSIFVMPSKYEGQGIVYVEAMSCGAPVIGCDNSAIPEMIEDGVNGYLIDRDSESLAQVLTSILEDDDLRVSMSESSREKAKDFDWGKIAAQTESLYQDLIN